MDGDDIAGEIARLEAEIEVSAAELASCRKVMAAARLTLAAGGTWLAAALFGLVALQPIGLIVAIAAIVGGIVLYGSNASTARQAETRMEAAEASRNRLITAIDPIAVNILRRLH
jgi:hypothetical protein